MKKFEHWQVAYRKDGMEKFQLVSNPSWGWAADPFLVEYNNTIYLFAELFLYKSERNGVIGYRKYEENGFGEWVVSMDRHWHLSYPNVWVEDGKIYMCPETYQADEVAIYELKEFPNQWEKVNILLQNAQYVDSTFLQYRGNRYLFTYRLKTGWRDGELLLYHIEKNGRLTDEAVISKDIGNARPGGKIFERDGKIIRVSQDSSQGYGNGLVFSEIQNLYPNYIEKEIVRIGAQDVQGNWQQNFTGIHTYNRCGDFEVIDLKFKTFSIAEYMARKRVRKVFMNKY